MSVKLLIAGGTYKAKYASVGNLECINFYPAIFGDSTDLSEAILLPHSGIEEVCASSAYAEANRGACLVGDKAYFVNGNTLYSVDSDYDKVSIGAIPGSGRVSLATNGSQLMILIPGNPTLAYCYTVGGSLVRITDSDFLANGNPLYVIFHDGSFVCTTDEKKWIQSDLGDCTSWNALLFGSAESDPDGLVAPVKVNNEVFILGKYTTEGFTNTGGAGFSYTRSGLFLDKGCSAPFSLCNLDNSFYMVGRGYQESVGIYRFTGSSYTLISTKPINQQLNSLSESELEDIYSYAYSDNGSFFVAFVFPTTTYVYDTTISKWSERRSIIEGVDSAHRVSSAVILNGEFLVGDTFDGRIGLISSDYYGEYGEDIHRIFSCLVLDSNKNEFGIDSVELVLDFGVGTIGIPNPQVGLSISTDLHTFGLPVYAPMSRTGQYKFKVIWTNLPQFPLGQGLLKFFFSDQVKTVVCQVRVE